MRLTATQRHRLNAVTLPTFTLIGGPLVIVSLVTASGVLPVRFELLLAAGIASGVIGALPAILFGRSRGRFAILAILAVGVTAVMPVLSFAYVQRRGLREAELYGARWAKALSETRAMDGGAWPESLHAVPPNRVPLLDLRWPYIAQCRENVCEKVGGYFLQYSVRAGAAHLTIARRDLLLEWDWSTGRWVD